MISRCKLALLTILWIYFHLQSNYNGLLLIVALDISYVCFFLTGFNTRTQSALLLNWYQLQKEWIRAEGNLMWFVNGEI
jgi:hypothetical protein